MALTEKQKAFCREYVANGGNATQAYLSAYDSKSPVSASIEGYRLLQSEDIRGYLASLTKPLEDIARTQAISERERKRAVLWQIVETGDNNAKCRALDILNRMDAEYMNINRNIDDNGTAITGLDMDTLKRLTGS